MVELAGQPLLISNVQAGVYAAFAVRMSPISCPLETVGFPLNRFGELKMFKVAAVVDPLIPCT
jgi:hypothetical protein